MFEIIIAIAVCGITVGISRKYGVWSLPSFAAVIFAVGYSTRLVILRATGENVVFEAFYVTDEQYRDMAGYGFIAFLAMCTGIFLGSARRPSDKFREAMGKDAPTYRPGLLLLLAVVAFAVQGYLLGRTFGSVGQAVTALSRRVFVGESFAAAAAISFVAMPLLIASCILARKHGNKALTGISFVAFIASLPVLAIVNGRATVIVAVWSLALASFLAFRKPLKPLTLAGFGALVLATPVVGLAWRASSQTGRPFAFEMQRYLDDFLSVFSESIPLFDHARVGMEYAGIYGPSAESSVFNAFSVLIPREIWPDKPEFLPQILGERLKYTELSGLPAGLLGEGFINGGWLGAIFAALVLGLFIGYAHRYLMLSTGLTPLAGWGVFTAVNTVIVSLRTGAQGGLTTIQISLVALLAVMLLGRIARVNAPKPALAPKSGLARVR